MNTENRSSNTEMVSVPREWAQHYADLLEERCGYEKAEQVTAFLAQPAQHQGEPVAWLARAVDADGTTYRQCVSTNKLTERDAKFAWGEGVMNRCSVVITPLGPLADPGEVERLRSELQEWKKRCQYNADTAHDVGRERDTLRAQLAERATVIPKGFALVPQSMLLSKEVIGAINFHCGDTDQEEGGQFGQYTDGRLWIGYVQDDDGNQVHGLQLATDEYPEEGSTTLIEFPAPPEAAEPGAATESESRAAFEAAYSQEVAVTEMAFLTNPDGSYALPIVNTAYRMWQAGAATKGAKA